MVTVLKPFPLFALGFLVCIAYIPGITGASISSGISVLIILMPIIFCFCKFKITPFHIAGLFFLGYVCLSLAWTFNFNIGFFTTLQLIALALVFCLGSSLKDIRPAICGASLGLGVSGIVAIFQVFGLQGNIFSINGAAGLFINVNIFGEVTVIILVSLIVLKLWYWIPTTIPGLLLMQSRAAVLSLVVCLLIWLWSKSKQATIVLFVSLLLCGLGYYLSHNFAFSSISERFSLWKDTLNGFKLFGNGVGSFELLYPLYATNIETWLARPKYAHNDLLELMFEFGIGTIFLIPLLYLVSIKKEERIILYAIGIISLFTFPFHVPISAFIACLVAGYLTRFHAADGRSRFDWRLPIFKRFENK